MLLCNDVALPESILIPPQATFFKKNWYRSILINNWLITALVTCSMLERKLKYASQVVLWITLNCHSTISLNFTDFRVKHIDRIATEYNFVLGNFNSSEFLPIRSKKHNSILILLFTNKRAMISPTSRNLILLAWTSRNLSKICHWITFGDKWRWSTASTWYTVKRKSYLATFDLDSESMTLQNINLAKNKSYGKMIKVDKRFLQKCINKVYLSPSKKKGLHLLIRGTFACSKSSRIYVQLAAQVINVPFMNPFVRSWALSPK